MEIAGKVRTYHLAVFASPASDFYWAYLYTNQKQDVFQEAHVQFFEMVGGVYQEVVYDNMRNVVTRFIGRSEKELIESLIKLSLYYGFEINVTNCFSGHEKGTVEGRVKHIRRQCFSKSYQFSSIEAARDHLTQQLIRLNQKSQIVEEKQYLLTYRPPFELAEMVQCRVNKYSIIQYETNAYSVPDYLVGHTVQLKVYPEYFVVYANHEEVCRHKKIEGSHQYQLDIYHYLKTLMKKTGALKHSLVLKHSPDLKAHYALYYKENPREFLDKLDQYQALPKEQLMEQLSQNAPARKSASLSQEAEAITEAIEADWSV
ncbi:Mu transposase domain-containing protein [Aerococcus urinaeequi]|uniref:Mu transposase domain-containing protein n=1 Tax=Aerococcus urinaeequi TaxID=51665 RepID=UPI0009F5594C|nr:DDE-type integrase/transposase/recombinase [Aerococcus urinaeequi]